MCRARSGPGLAASQLVEIHAEDGCGLRKRRARAVVVCEALVETRGARNILCDVKETDGVSPLSAPKKHL
jgi:hypothetical protein